MPRLDAEERLSEIHALQVGSGLMKEADQRKAIRQLRRAAGYREAARQPTGADLAAMGIRVGG